MHKEHDCMPADIVDQAQDLVDSNIQSALQNRKVLSVPYSGACLSCGEPVTERRYCDSFCREEHEASLKRRTPL